MSSNDNHYLLCALKFELINLFKIKRINFFWLLKFYK